MPTKTEPKTKQPTIADLENHRKIAEAAVLRARADVLRLEDQLEHLSVEHASISVKTAGSKTAAVRALEEVDKRRGGLKRSLTLATAAVSECEAELEAAEAALKEAHAAEQEKRIQSAARASHKAKLEFEEALDKLVEAKKQVVKTDLDLRRTARAAGVDVPWTDIDTRMAHRVTKRLKMVNINPSLLAAPAPALATRGDDGA